MEIVTLRHSRCFENGNDDFGVEAFWAIHCVHWSSCFFGSKRFNYTGSWSALYLRRDEGLDFVKFSVYLLI